MELKADGEELGPTLIDYGLSNNSTNSVMRGTRRWYYVNLVLSNLRSQEYFCNYQN